MTREEIAEIYDARKKRAGDRFIETGDRDDLEAYDHSKRAAALLRWIEEMDVREGRKVILRQMEESPAPLPSFAVVDPDYDWGIR